MSGAIVWLRALTPLHAGAGAAIGAIDLPIQREKHTNWPMIQAGGVKGVFRDAARLAVDPNDPVAANSDADIKTVFGPDTTGANEHGGAVAITDARILLFPVRSLKGVYALLTCPAVLSRLGQDCQLAGLSPVPELGQSPREADREAYCAEPGTLFFPAEAPREAVLEDFAVVHTPNDAVESIAKWLAPPDGNGLLDRLAIVPDNVFKYSVSYRTEVATRNAIDPKTKIVVDGALFSQEFLPPETVMYSVMLADRHFCNNGGTVDVLGKLSGWVAGKCLQFGGDATTGKGICKVSVRRGQEAE